MDTTRDLLLLCSWLLAPVCAVLLLVFVAPLDLFSLMRRGAGDMDLVPSKMVPLLKESWKAGVMNSPWKAGIELTSLRANAALPHAKEDPPAAEPRCAASGAASSMSLSAAHVGSPKPTHRSVSMPLDSTGGAGGLELGCAPASATPFAAVSARRMPFLLRAAGGWSGVLFTVRVGCVLCVARTPASILVQ